MPGSPLDEARAGVGIAVARLAAAAGIPLVLFGAAVVALGVAFIWPGNWR